MRKLLAVAKPPEFSGLGPSILAQQSRGRVRRHVLPKGRMESRSMLHDHCPLTPGVYAWLDGRQQICYVGKSKCLRKRLLSYFAKTPAEAKAERIRRTATTLVWEPISEELLALIREQELIYRWRPEFNTQGQPVKRQPAFLCVGGKPAPHAFFSRRIVDKAEHVFGPIAGTGKLRGAVESLNQAFQLRDCPDKTHFEFNDHLQLFENPITPKCIRYELGSCPGPCARKCSRQDYHERVRHALAFINGKDTSILHSLDAQMQNAAAQCSFERAAVLRDQITSLRWLTRRLNDLQMAKKNYNGILPMAARKDRTIWLVLKGGRLVGSAPAPDSPARAATAAKFLFQQQQESDRLPGSIMEMNLQMILISWFRKNRTLAKSLIPFESAIEICGRKATAA